MYTYVFAFYLKKNNQSIIFEVGANVVPRSSDDKDEWNRGFQFGEMVLSICVEVFWIFCLQYSSPARHCVGALLAEEAELQVATLWNKKKDQSSGFELAKNAQKLKAGVLHFPGLFLRALSCLSLNCTWRFKWSALQVKLLAVWFETILCWCTTQAEGFWAVCRTTEQQSKLCSDAAVLVLGVSRGFANAEDKQIHKGHNGR